MPNTKPKEKRTTVLGVAEKIIRGDRQKDYGHPRINFQRIATVWNGYFHERGTIDDNPLTPHDVTQLMILLKAVRGAEGYKRDSAVDIGGYAALDAVLAEDDEL